MFETHRNQMIGMDWNDIFRFCIQELPEINAGQVIFSLRVTGKLFRVILTDDGNKKLVWRRDLMDSLLPPPLPVSALRPSCECGEWVDCNRCAGSGTYEYEPYLEYPPRKAEADAVHLQSNTDLELPTKTLHRMEMRRKFAEKTGDICEEQRQRDAIDELECRLNTQFPGATRNTWQTRDPTQMWLNLKAAETAIENNNRRIEDNDIEYMKSFSNGERQELVRNLGFAQRDWDFIRPDIKEEIEKVARGER